MVQAPPSRRGGQGRGGPGRSGPPGQNRQQGGSGGDGRGRGPRDGRPPRERAPREEDTGGFSERVVYTRRIAKVVKGGRRLRFNALVVVGDGQGTVGAGLGKALAIPDAVRKGNAVARRENGDSAPQGKHHSPTDNGQEGRDHRAYQAGPGRNRRHRRRRDASHTGVGRRQGRGR